MPRAQPGRKRLAVYARQLALQPHLQILRRSRRPLLCGLEQARRSALAHHVHRIAPMGARVLIIGIWYKPWSWIEFRGGRILSGSLFHPGTRREEAHYGSDDWNFEGEKTHVAISKGV